MRRVLGAQGRLDEVIWDGRVRGFGRWGRVWRRPQKVNLGRKWGETEDERTSSCEKLRVVLAVILVGAVCQNTLQKLKSMRKYRKPDFRTSGTYSDPPIC